MHNFNDTFYDPQSQWDELEKDGRKKIFLPVMVPE